MKLVLALMLGAAAAFAPQTASRASTSLAVGPLPLGRLFAAAAGAAAASAGRLLPLSDAPPAWLAAAVARAGAGAGAVGGIGAGTGDGADASTEVGGAGSRADVESGAGADGVGAGAGGALPPADHLLGAGPRGGEPPPPPLPPRLSACLWTLAVMKAPIATPAFRCPSRLALAAALAGLASLGGPAPAAAAPSMKASRAAPAWPCPLRLALAASREGEEGVPRGW